jgi:hypothetical protein
MIELIAILKFFMKFLGVYFDERIKAAQRHEEYKLSETEIFNITAQAIQRIRDQAEKERSLANKGENWIEEELSDTLTEEPDSKATSSESESNEHDLPRKTVRGRQS